MNSTSNCECIAQLSKDIATAPTASNSDVKPSNGGSCAVIIREAFVNNLPVAAPFRVKPLLWFTLAVIIAAAGTVPDKTATVILSYSLNRRHTGHRKAKCNASNSPISHRRIPPVFAQVYPESMTVYSI